MLNCLLIDGRCASQISLARRLSPNQVLTHAARAAAPLVAAPLVAARGAREGLWLEQRRLKMRERIERAGQ